MKNIIKKLPLVALFTLSFCFFTAFIAVSAHSVYAAEIKVFYNDIEIPFDVPPQIVNSRVLVPMSATIEAITGFKTEWDPVSKTVMFRAKGQTMRHTIGQSIIYADGRALHFDTPSQIIGSRTLVPIRMIAETSGCEVEWDAKNRHVLIKSKLFSSAEPPEITFIEYGRGPYKNGDKITVTVSTNNAVEYVVFTCPSIEGGGRVTRYKLGTDTRTWTDTFTAVLAEGAYPADAEITITAYNAASKSVKRFISVRLSND